jgi:hypothetical protein
MDIGTGILAGCAVLSGTLIVWRLLGLKKKNNNNPNSKYLLTERFDEYKEGIKIQLKKLTDSVVRIESGIKRLHSRIDDTLKG